METNTSTLTDQYVAIQKPSMYAVIMHNDNETPMDFVVELLVKIFHKPVIEASELMMAIHQDGQGLAGIYTYDIAVTKKGQADQRSSEKGFPLKITLQEVIS